MQQERWFDIPVIGESSSATITATLTRLGEIPDFEEPFPTKGRRTTTRSDDFPDFEGSFPTKGRRDRTLEGFRPYEGLPRPRFKMNKPWLHTGHMLGFIGPNTTNNPTPILDPGAIRPDRQLRKGHVKITLDRLHVAGYPGRGIHRILLHFFAQHQTAQQIEDLHFNATYRAENGANAAVRGYPIFVGLGVGLEGLRVRCRTINVGNEADFAILNVLESGVFQSGLRLVSTAQPAIGPLSELAFGMAKAIASRNQNVSVQDIDLGLDFGTTPMGARLAEGSYIVAQVPASQEIYWDEWCFHPSSGQILHQDDRSLRFQFNYLIFSISRCSIGD